MACQDITALVTLITAILAAITAYYKLRKSKQ